MDVTFAVISCCSKFDMVSERKDLERERKLFLFSLSIWMGAKVRTRRNEQKPSFCYLEAKRWPDLAYH